MIPDLPPGSPAQVLPRIHPVRGGRNFKMDISPSSSVSPTAIRGVMGDPLEGSS